MTRLLLALTFAFWCSACIDPDDGYYGGGPYGPVNCQIFTSCGTCTPVLGCGWCSMGTKGACVDQPNACAGASNFSWTWERSGCPGEGDAGAAEAPDGASTDGNVTSDVGDVAGEMSGAD